MPSSISSKSTGQLVDELVTNAFRTWHAGISGAPLDELERRYDQLREVLTERLGPELAACVHALSAISMATWQAQEVLMHDADDARALAAARHAQRTNAHRCRIIREIDRLVGDDGITLTSKTYG